MNATPTWLQRLLSPALSAGIMLIVGLWFGVWIAEPPAAGATGGQAMVAPAAPPATSGHDHGAAAPPAAPAPSSAATPPAATIWTCSMDPQIRLPNPGSCPICGMDLIPSGNKGGSAAAPQVVLSAAARALARIETEEVVRRAVTVPVRMVGKVSFDETRVARITAWFGGRIERVFVDFTGTQVRTGDHLLSLYSPELLVAQQELIQAARDARHAGAGDLGEIARATYQAARDRLRLWGLLDWQVRQIERRGRPIEHVTIFAPMGGIVLHKNALEGGWVQTGTPLYTIADLRHVWVELDAYESDIGWLRFGQRIEFEAAAFPGVRFDGTIAFVSPTMDAMTRTVKVRVDVANPDLKLKPEMFVRAQVNVVVGGEGQPTGPELAGKFVCPMHPTEVSDKAGSSCTVCGMKLVPASEHWLVGPALAPGSGGDAPLVIPHTAPLFTGKRTVVFVEQQQAPPAGDEPAADHVYLVREVRLGARAGDVYIVQSGLMAGERVVKRGAFRLDSSMQIVGDPSVMNPGPATSDDPVAADPPAAASPSAPLPSAAGGQR